MIEKLNDSNIKDWVYTDKAHIILFYSETIPNAKAIKKVFEEFDEQFQGKVQVMLCEYDKVTLVKEYYKMTTLPAILFMKSAKCYGNLVGPASKAKYQEIVKEGLLAIMKEQGKF